VRRLDYKTPPSMQCRPFWERKRRTQETIIARVRYRNSIRRRSDVSPLHRCDPLYGISIYTYLYTDCTYVYRVIQFWRTGRCACNVW
jgi:hypothetical protein